MPRWRNSWRLAISPTNRLRLTYLLAAIITVPVGLAVRFVPLGLPQFVVKYGGSTLWAVMVYWVLAFLWPRRTPAWLAFLAAAIAALVEFQRLWHLPALDTFRMTLPGILLLGRFFSVWDIAAYWIAILAAALCDTLVIRPTVGRQRG
ncbi:DUF2809 domain-containing protein [soil metagenome]